MKNLKLLLAILPAFISYTGNAQNRFDAQVFVQNFDDVAIPDATVELYDTSGTFVSKGTTDDEGKFIMNMKPGKYIVKLRKQEKVVKERTINLPNLEGRKVYNRVRIFVLYEERKHFKLENLLFEYNSAHIYKESFATLNKLVDYLFNTDGKFEIGGHTDAIGTEKDNQILSENRAIVVRDYCIAHGIPAERLLAKGYGESVPVSDNETEEGRALNRRTEVKLIEE